MDFSKFSGDEFDVKEWINTAFKTQKEGSSDQYAATLVMKLQMFIQEVNNVIDESCQQAVNTLPRVVRELEAVRQEALMLQEQMRAVKHDIEKVEQNTSHSMQTLQYLDTIKYRMKEASQALQEADNWTSLSADVDQVFESGNVQAMAEKLVGMQQSLNVLTDVPDYTERCQFLETLKNRLEALVSPQVVAAFSSQNTENALQLVRIFTAIDREPQLHKYFYKCHKSGLQQYWQDILQEYNTEPLWALLQRLYDQLIATWHTRYQWTSQVFGTPHVLVCELLSQTLKTLEPSIASCLLSAMTNCDSPLDTLSRLISTTRHFSQSLQTAIGSNAEGPEVERLASTIYSVYRPYIQQYPDYESSYLSTVLDSIPLDHSDVGECVTLLQESIPKLFQAIRNANDRCTTITHGCAYIAFLKVLQNCIDAYQRELKRVLVNIREKCQLDNANLELDNWHMFQSALEVIQTFGQGLLEVEQLEQQLTASILHISQPSVKSDSEVSVFENYPQSLLATSSEKQHLMTLYTQINEGDVSHLLEDTSRGFEELSQAAHQFAFDIVFKSLLCHLKQVSTLDTWLSESAGGALTSELPAFSLAPQEYITKIGQYLMTLPQQLEPFSLENFAMLTALKHGRLPFTPEGELPEHLASLWLEAVSRGTMHHYVEQILIIPELSSHAAKQLVADIEYLINVLDDLGLQPSETVSQIVQLLQASEDDYYEVSDNMSKRLSSAIANMRNLRLD